MKMQHLHHLRSNGLITNLSLVTQSFVCRWLMLHQQYQQQLLAQVVEVIIMAAIVIVIVVVTNEGQVVPIGRVHDVAITIIVIALNAIVAKILNLPAMLLQVPLHLHVQQLLVAMVMVDQAIGHV
jgi:hypothetical protein